MRKIVVIFLVSLFLTSCSKDEKSEEQEVSIIPEESRPVLVEFRDRVFQFGSIEAGIPYSVEAKIKANSTILGDNIEFTHDKLTLLKNECLGKKLALGDQCSLFFKIPQDTRVQSINNKITLAYQNSKSDTAMMRGEIVNSLPETVDYQIKDEGYDKKILTLTDAKDKYGNTMTDLITIRSNKFSLKYNNLIRSSFSFPFVPGKQLEIIPLETKQNK